MRHRLAGRKLGRTTEHRLAMLNNMVTELFRHEQIRTTVPKAKEARRIAEKMVTFAKRGGLHARRMAFRTVKDNAVLEKLFSDIAARSKARPGGYTRVLKAGFRPGDAAPMAILELVDRKAPEAEAAKPEEKKA
jgi:large subunit ribosomal protein L17